MLKKKLIRDIWGAKGQFIGVLVVICIGVMFYIGLNSISRNLKTSSEDYYKDYRLADLEVTGCRIPRSISGYISSMPEVRNVTSRVEFEAKVKLSGSNTQVSVLTLPDIKADIVNDIDIISGRYFSGRLQNECLVDEAYFKKHGLKLGDKLKYISKGLEDELIIVGCVKGPEFVYNVRDASQILADNFKYGVAYIKDSYAVKVFGWGDSVNSLCIKLNDDYDVKAFKEKLSTILKKYGTAVLTEKKDQLSYRMLKSELDELSEMGESVPFVFFLVALAVMYILISRLTEKQRTEIGVLKALGYSDLKVLLHYLGYPVMLSAAGIASGIVSGFILGRYMTYIENKYFNLPMGDIKIYWDLAVISSAAAIAFSLLAGFFSCYKIYRILPGEAMRPKAPKGGKKIMLETIPLFWSNLKYNWKIILRNIFRDKRRTILTSTGIILSAATIVVGFGIKDAINYMIDQYLVCSLNYDLKIKFDRLISSEELAAIRSMDHVKTLEPLLETGVEAKNGWKTKKIMLTGVTPEPRLFTAVDKKGRKADIPEKGLLFPARIANDIGIETGSLVELKTYLPGKKEKTVVTGGTVEQYISFSAYGTLDTVGSIINESGAVNAAVLRLDSLESRKAVEDRLYTIPAVSNVETSEDTLKNLKEFMGAMSSFSIICVLSAAALSVALLYNISSISIFERKNDYAVMKMLGHKDSMIMRLVFNENYIIAFISALCGLPAGYLLNVFILGMVNAEEYTIPNTVVYNETYIIAVCLIMLFTAITNLLLKRKIIDIDLVETLKSRE